MASGYNRKPFLLKTNTKEKRHPLDKPAVVRVLVRDGVELAEPQLLTDTAEMSIANRLREEASRSERALLPHLIQLGFKHSYPLFGYYLDFYHPALRLCVEIDGKCHSKRRSRDKRRDSTLKYAGIETQRFWASAALYETERVVQHIKNIIERKTPYVREEPPA